MRNYTPKNLLFYIIISITLINVAGTKVIAQNHYDFQQFIDEGRDFVKRPVKWDLGDWLKFGGLAAGVYAVMHFDDDIKSEIQKDQSYTKSFPIVFGRQYGEPYTTAALGLFFLIHGKSSSNSANTKLGFDILESFAFTGAVTGITKIAFGRKRPSMTNDQFDFNPFHFFNDDSIAFFSGHTSTAFSLSTIISGNLDGTGWKILSYVPAFITAFSRVYENRHWTSDVLMGAAVGYLVGRYVINTHNEKEKYYDGKLIPPQPLLSFSIPVAFFK